MKDDLHHYPAWLRKEIFPRDPDSKLALCDLRENENALYYIYQSYRLNPVNRILFMLAIKSIRNKFKMRSLEEKIKDLQNQINDLKESHK
jgi:hypothetical protein